MDTFAIVASHLSLHSYLLSICHTGTKKIWAFKGRLVSIKTYTELQPLVGRTWLSSAKIIYYLQRWGIEEKGLIDNLKIQDN